MTHATRSAASEAPGGPHGWAASLPELPEKVTAFSCFALFQGERCSHVASNAIIVGILRGRLLNHDERTISWNRAIVDCVPTLHFDCVLKVTLLVLMTKNSYGCRSQRPGKTARFFGAPHWIDFDLSYRIRGLTFE